MQIFGSLAFAYALPLDGHTPGLELAAQHRRRGRDRGGVMLRRIERELAFQIHVELAGALQVPFQPPGCQLVLDHLAGRIDGAADGAEGLFKVRHVGGQRCIGDGAGLADTAGEGRSEDSACRLRRRFAFLAPLFG